MITLWGSNSRVCSGPQLHSVKGYGHASLYHNILDNSMLLNSGQAFFFSNVTVPLHANFNEELDWPEPNPDLNPTKHLWDAPRLRWRARPSRPTLAPDLINAPLNDWVKIHTETPLKSYGKLFEKGGSRYRRYRGLVLSF